jgi:hypothetical protein
MIQKSSLAKLIGRKIKREQQRKKDNATKLAFMFFMNKSNAVLIT